MTRRSQFADAPLAWHQAQEHLRFDFVRGVVDERHKEAFQRRAQPSRAAQAPKALLPFTSFAVITAVMLFIYMCSLSIRKRRYAWSLWRRLASSREGEEGNESDWCSLEASSEDSSDSSELRAEGLEPVFGGQFEHAKSETEASTSPTVGSVAPYKGQVSRWATTQLDTDGVTGGVKRKRRGALGTEKSAKYFKVREPREESPPLPQPPLDPELDSLIDTVLFREEVVLHESFWLSDEKGESEALEALSGNLEDPEEDAGGAQGLPADASALEAAPGASSSTAGLKRGPTSGGSESDPLDFFHAVLSENRPASSPDDWVFDDDEFPLGEPVDTDPGPPKLTPTTSGPDIRESITVRGKYQQTSYAHPPRPADLGAPSTSGTQNFGDQVSLDQASASGLGHVSTAEMHPPAQRWDTSFRQPNVGSVPYTMSAPTIFGSIPLEQVAYAGPPAGEQSDQSVSTPPPLTVLGSFAVPIWLESMYRGVPDRILQTHPFYFHPQRQGNLGRSFCPRIAASFRPLRRVPLQAMEQCRRLMKKKQLTTAEFQDLVHVTERLVGYATGCMPKFVVAESLIPAVNSLGSIFLVLDALYCAAEALGENANRSLWWPDVIRHIRGVRYPPVERRSRNAAIAEMLDLALNYYRRSLRPPPRLVVCLKEILFDQFSPFKFSGTAWAAWRSDITDWLKDTFPERPTSSSQ